MKNDRFDVVVIGSGPAGQHAAIEAANAGRQVAVIERQGGVGGACVHYGTIPSKALRETAIYLSGLRRRVRHQLVLDIPADLQLVSLMARMERVVEAHVAFQGEQLARWGIKRIHGRARFRSDREVEVESVRGQKRVVEGNILVLATGSRPRTPPGIPVDHEHVFDSDSILGMAYVPKSMTVLGGGVIAGEYASIFSALGVEVTMIDRSPRPLAFLDEEVVDRYVRHFESQPGCVFVGNAQVSEVAWDGVGQVVTRLDNGWETRAEKVLCALGRVANVEGLDVSAAGLVVDGRGYVEVDADCRTATPHVIAVGDVAGPPTLASSAMEEGRRAIRNALALPFAGEAEMVPVGVYTIPEIASVGLTEKEAGEHHGGCMVGRAPFHEVTRGHIACNTDGLLKLVADTAGERVLGAQVFGEGATEMIHLAQMAIVHDDSVDFFVENLFNFPTLAEAYRVAALDVIRQRDARYESAVQSTKA